MEDEAQVHPPPKKEKGKKFLSGLRTDKNQRHHLVIRPLGKTSSSEINSNIKTNREKEKPLFLSKWKMRKRSSPPVVSGLKT